MYLNSILIFNINFPTALKKSPIHYIYRIFPPKIPCKKPNLFRGITNKKLYLILAIISGKLLLPSRCAVFELFIHYIVLHSIYCRWMDKHVFMSMSRYGLTSRWHFVFNMVRTFCCCCCSRKNWQLTISVCFPRGEGGEMRGLRIFEHNFQLEFT